MKLQSISEKLSELNWKRNLEFSENQNDDNSNLQFLHSMEMFTMD